MSAPDDCNVHVKRPNSTMFNMSICHNTIKTEFSTMFVKKWNANGYK